MNQQNLNLNKYRRIQTMQKKCAEISLQCNVDVVCIIYDKKFNRFREIRTTDHMTYETVHQMMNEVAPGTKKPKYQRILVGYDDVTGEDNSSVEPQVAAVPELDLDLKLAEGVQEHTSISRDADTTDEHSVSHRGPSSTSEQFEGLKQIANQIVGQKRKTSQNILPSFAPKI